MRLPNFLVIGAARSGTTTLHYALGQHPEVFVSPNKETNFFLFDEAGEPVDGFAGGDLARQEPRSVKSLDHYAALFAGATDQHRAIGESSPAYLAFPAVAGRIKARLPEAKLVAVLRHPVEQALSLFTARGGGSMPQERLAEAFVDALETGASRPGHHDGLPIAQYGLYHRQLSIFLEHFDRSQLKVLLFEDMQRDSTAFFEDLFAFLGVDPSFRPDFQRYNEAGVARITMLHRVLSGSQNTKRWLRRVLPHGISYSLARLQHRLRSANLRRPQALSPELRRELTERFYADDIAALEGLVGRDLSHWRQ